MLVNVEIGPPLDRLHLPSHNDMTPVKSQTRPEIMHDLYAPAKRRA
jgi:hypothetical protein